MLCRGAQLDRDRCSSAKRSLRCQCEVLQVFMVKKNETSLGQKRIAFLLALRERLSRKIEARFGMKFVESTRVTYCTIVRTFIHASFFLKDEPEKVTRVDSCVFKIVP